MLRHVGQMVAQRRPVEDPLMKDPIRAALNARGNAENVRSAST